MRTQHAKSRSDDRVHRDDTIGLGLLSPNVQLQASEVHATPGQRERFTRHAEPSEAVQSNDSTVVVGRELSKDGQGFAA
ncbi:MAG: hypothetical protein AAFO89_01995 [Planctomycetota bacterium]